jgi:excisionase family DNA binding protein
VTFLAAPAAVVAGWPAVVVAVALRDLQRRGYFDRLPADQRAAVARTVDDIEAAGTAWRRSEGPGRVTTGQDGSVVAVPVGMPDDASVLVSIAQAADRLGVSVSSVKRLVGSGALPSVCVGRARRVHRDDLEGFARRGGTA